MATIETTLSIADLKMLPIPSDNTIVYVEGYYGPSDGGGGMFRFDKDSMTQPDLGVNFIPDSVKPDGAGRWIRQYHGHLNVAYFGIWRFQENIYDAPSGEKNHVRLQNAIDYCHRNSTPVPTPVPLPYVDGPQVGDFTIYFPEGLYWLQPDFTLTLRSRTHLKGDTTSFIRLLNVSIDYLFKIDRGPVQKLCIERLRFDLGAILGGEQANPTGFLHAKALETFDGDQSGGIYSATITDLFVENVGNHGIHFEGGEFDISDPFWARKCNQFIYLENVWVERQFDYKNSYRITGLNVNLTFTNCNPTLNTYAESRPTLLGSSFYIDSVLPHAPANNISIIFTGCDTGGAPGRPGEFGFYIKNSQNIFIQNSWIEDSEVGVFIKDSQAISILDTHFANAAANGSLPDTMYPDRNSSCIVVENSFVNIERNHVSITDTEAPNICNSRFISGVGETNVINSSNNYFNGQILSQTYGIAQYVSVGVVRANFLKTNPATPPPVPPAELLGINTTGKKVVMVRVGADGSSDIYRINSTLSPGETINVLAEDGDLTFHSMGLPEWGGKNIIFVGLITFTLKHGHTATFMKMDRINGHEKAVYQLTATF